MVDEKLAIAYSSYILTNFHANVLSCVHMHAQHRIVFCLCDSLSVWIYQFIVGTAIYSPVIAVYGKLAIH